jgi:hypothetical protein
MVVPRDAVTDEQLPPEPDAGPPVDPAVDPPAPPPDPITARRAQIAAWVLLGKRVGYSALAVAIAVFSVALYWDLPSVLIGIIVACLVVACVTLAPSIVFGYGVMAADREDRELRDGGKPARPPRGRT